MSNQEKSAQEIYAGLLEHLRNVKERLASEKTFEVESAVKWIELIIDDPARMQEISPLAAYNIQDVPYMISHQTNTMIYALKIGLGLGYSRETLRELGLAALLHDIGIFRISDALLHKSGPLTPSETKLMESHSELGSVILSPFSQDHPSLSEVVYQHHERFNGTGYPRGLKGGEIHEQAQIICLVDAYEAMTHNRPQRKALKQNFTAKELISQSRDSAFPPNVVRVFLTEITPYPEGSCVVLNNGLVCEVISVNRANPLRPDVRILYHDKGQRMPQEKILKLREEHLFFIVDTIARTEMQGS